MTTRTVALSLASVVLLTACGGEPSESEMKVALENYFSDPSISWLQLKLVSIKKIGCEEKHASSYVCDYETEGTVMGKTEKGVATATFIKSSTGWVFKSK